jgi:hypothetical protein
MTQMHPYLASQLAIERHATCSRMQQQRTARQLIALHRASRQAARAERAQQRVRHALRTAARLRTELGH